MPRPANPDLTAREIEMLRYAYNGFTGRQTAEALNVSHDTVKTHLRHAYAKLGVKNRAGAVLAFGKKYLDTDRFAATDGAGGIVCVNCGAPIVEHPYPEEIGEGRYWVHEADGSVVCGLAHPEGSPDVRFPTRRPADVVMQLPRSKYRVVETATGWNVYDLLDGSYS